MAHICLKCGLQFYTGDRSNITIKADGFEHKDCNAAVAKSLEQVSIPPKKESKPLSKPFVMEEKKKDSYLLRQTTDWVDNKEIENGK